MAKKFKSFGSVVALRVIISMAVVLAAAFVVSNFVLTKVINENYNNLLKISIEGIKWDMGVFKKELLKELEDFLYKRTTPMFLDYIVEGKKVLYNSTRYPDDYVRKMASLGEYGDLGGIPFWNVKKDKIVGGLIVDDVVLRRFLRNIRGNGFLVFKVGRAIVMPRFLKGTAVESVVKNPISGHEIFVNDGRYFFRSFRTGNLVVYAFLSATIFDDIRTGLMGVLAITFIAGMVVIAYILRIVAKYLSKNLRMILDGFEKLREGEFEFLDIESHDELGMIMGEFNVTVAVLRDAMEKMKMAKEMAEEANRTKSMFLATVSHEIRNPLNSILGFAELLLREEKDPKKREYLETIYRSGEHLLNVINDILDLSKIEAGKMELVYEVYNPKKLVEEVVQMYQPQAMKKGIDIFSEIARDVPEKAVADPFRLKQILINLVSNSVKFTDEGYVKISLSRDGEYLLYVVEDTGIGIPKEKLEKIFEPFTQADASVSAKYGGTGLGLSISKRLARMMKGDLWLESDVGKGTRAYLKVPIKVISEEEMTKLRKEKREDLALLSIKDEDLKELIKGFLKDLGFEMQEKSFEEIKEEVNYVEPRLVVVEAERTSDVGGKLREIPTMVFLPPGSTRLRLKNALFLPTPQPGEEAAIIDELMDFLGISLKGSIRVAIVDDNKVNRTLILRMLAEIAIVKDTAEFEDGEDIVSAVENGEDFDLVLMDVQMQRMDGYEACSKMRELGFEGKIILATGSSGEDVIIKALEAGCDDVVSKPVKLEELSKKIWKFFPKAIKRAKKGREREVEEKSSEKVVENIEREPAEFVEEEVPEIEDSESPEEIEEKIDLLEKAVQKMENEMGMDREVAIGMIQDYLRFLKRKHRNLVDALTKLNEAGIRRVAHDLAGSGEMYGFEEITEMGRKISERMNEEDYEGVAKLAKELERFIGSLERALKNFQLS